MPHRSIHAAGLAAILAGLLVAPAFPQRAYQKFWMEKLEEQEPPEIIDDHHPPRDLSEEEPLFDDPVLGQMFPLTVFPGQPEPEPDPVAKLALRQYALGALATEKGSAGEAVRFLSEAAEKDPENPWLGLQLAQAALQVNDLSRAQAILEELLKADPENYRALLLLGEIASMRRNYPAAKDRFNEVLKLKPDNVAALTAMAQIAFEVERDLEATKQFAHKVLTIDDGNLRALLWNAEAAAFTGDVAHAAELYTRLVRYNPTLIHRMSEVARQLGLRGHQEDAILLFEQALTIDPDESALRLEWEEAVQKLRGEDGLRAAYQRLMEESNNDDRIANLYARHLKEDGDMEALVELRRTMLEEDPSHTESLLDIANYHLDQDRFEKARPFLEQALASNPADPDIHRDIGLAFLSHDRLEEARKHLERALRLKPDDVAALTAMARLHQQAGEHEKAEELLRKALDLSPANSKLLRELGTLYLDQGRRTEAKDVLQQVLIVDQFDFETWLAVAELFLEDNDTKKLDLLEEQSRMTMQNFPKVLVQYGALAQGFGEFERSRRALERALKVTPQDMEARLALTRAYVALNQPELAEHTMEAALEMAPDQETRRQVRRLLAGTYVELGMHGEAIKLLEKLVDEAPGDLALREQLLAIYAKNGEQQKFQQGMNDLVRLFKLDNPVETERARARLFRVAGDPSRALSTLRRLAADQPENPDVWLDLAIAATDAEEIALAEQFYRKLLKMGPPEENTFYETAANNLGYMLADRGERLDEAEQLIREAHALNPRAGYILDSLGWLYFRKGDLEQARSYLTRAARLLPGDAEVYYHLGEVHEALGNREQARTWYDKALEHDPDMEQAKKRRDALLSAAP